MFSRRFVPGNNKTNNSFYGQNTFQRSRVMSPNNTSMNIGGGLLNS